MQDYGHGLQITGSIDAASIYPWEVWLESFSNHDAHACVFRGFECKCSTETIKQSQQTYLELYNGMI